MRRALEQVMEFHEKYGSCISTNPCLPDGPFVIPKIVLPHSTPKTERQLRINLLIEEVEELFSAEQNNDLVDIADALGDIIYIAIGTAIAYGIPIDAVFNEIHRSNMTKEGKVGPGTKVGKGPSYSPPDITAAINSEAEDCCDFRAEIRRLRNENEELSSEVDALSGQLSTYEEEYIDPSTYDTLTGFIDDLIGRCSICNEEKQFFGESWICNDCVSIKKSL